MILGLVGHAQDKFTPETEELARAFIRGALRNYLPKLVVSGACPMGGVDLYAIEEAKKMGIETQEFAPGVNQWEGTSDKPGFHQRNMQIAETADVTLSLVLTEFPPNFKGRKFAFCYHHRDQPNFPAHIKSGGCWTAKHARSVGKIGKTIILK